jgi:hypothetical protein
MTLALVVIFVVLQILDAVSTRLGQKQAGVVEDNDGLVLLAEKLRSITNARWAWLLIAKLFAIAIVVGFHWLGWWDLRWQGIPLAACLIVVNAVYMVVVYRNFAIYRQQKG